MLYIIIGIIVLLIIYTLITYNNLVKINNIVKEAFSNNGYLSKKKMGFNS